MPKDTLQRSINKANDKDAAQMMELTFECHVNHGIALFIEALSDNNNRTVANVKSIMNKNGGTLETNGSLAFLFTRKGVFVVPRKPEMDIEELEMELIDGGLEEMEADDEYLTLYTAYEDFGNMVKMLEQKGIECESAELQRIPNTLRQVDTETIRKVMKIIGILEEDEDVTNVYHDMEIPDDFEEE
jgi:YebC/PmpR family DNA-binding regulatory protein